MKRPAASRRTDLTACSSGSRWPEMAGTVLLVRHGETEWNRVRRYQGWLDSPLTPEGIAQAEAIGRRLRLLPEAAHAEIVAECLIPDVQDTARYPSLTLPRKRGRVREGARPLDLSGPMLPGTSDS